MPVPDATAATLAADVRGRPVRLHELVAHLAWRELRSMHRATALGVLWPLLRLAAQWAVLGLLFTRIVDLDIRHYPAFLLCGLVPWSWFATGLGAGTTALLSHRHLVLQPRVPDLALPAVAVSVPLADLLVALPLLLAVVGATAGLSPALLLLPLLVAAQFVLVCGLVWISSAITVFARDVRGLVELLTGLLFYATPVFYDERRVPEELRPLIEINPMTHVVAAWRSVLIDGRLPALVDTAVVIGTAIAAAAIGLALFRRLQPRFVDEL